MDGLFRLDRKTEEVAGPIFLLSMCVEELSGLPALEYIGE